MEDVAALVVLYASRKEIADAISTGRRSPGCFPDVQLPRALRVTTDPAAALDDADCLVLSAPPGPCGMTPLLGAWPGPLAWPPPRATTRPSWKPCHNCVIRCLP
ncbi:hypothetical protein [Streptomyces sp. AV19]|uniref:hypothetical protein n=1 Tax=Streptomyces sp. AV19 TaxID=2793068 RepID=UPI0024138809|nr:hypothetical protein [Streptomyces sp. AV19]MDG4533613.1 hypothetical protein [Streptomyces sp. AV19]